VFCFYAYFILFILLWKFHIVIYGYGNYLCLIDLVKKDIFLSFSSVLKLGLGRLLQRVVFYKLRNPY